jgi:HK97 family phage prohead protease
MPGCFASSLMSGKSIRLLVQHAGIGLLGTVRDRLELLEDDDGLAFRYELADTAHAKEIARLVEAGQLAEMSIGYKVLRHEIKTIEGSSVRLIREGDLDEISIVGRGAVPGTHCRLVDGRKRSTLREELKSGTLTEPDAIDWRSKSETAWQRLIANLRRAQDVLE